MYTFFCINSNNIVKTWNQKSTLKNVYNSCGYYDKRKKKLEMRIEKWKFPTQVKMTHIHECF